MNVSLKIKELKILLTSIDRLCVIPFCFSVREIGPFTDNPSVGPIMESRVALLSDLSEDSMQQKKNSNKKTPTKQKRKPKPSP